MSATEQFIGVIRKSLGYAPDPEKIIPGKMIRFATNDEKRDQAGWCKLFEDGMGGIYGCWRQGISKSWQADIFLTHEEKAAFWTRVKLAREEADRIDTENRRICREQSAELWKKGRDIDAKHPYLALKGVKPHGIKQLGQMLLVPVKDMDDTLNGLQFVMPDGIKRLKKDTSVKGCYHAMGNPDGMFLIAEGYATSATLHEITGHTVACAFNSGNLRPAAEALKKKFPDTILVICADDDYLREGNPGLTKATEAAKAVDGLLAVPVFPPNRGAKDTDFNDLARIAGPEKVRECIDQARKPEIDQKEENAELPFIFRRMSEIEAKPVRWLWPGRIARGKVSILAGHPGLGKSQLTASLAAIVSTGGIWPLDSTPCEPGNVFVFSAEDDAEDTIRPRLEAAGADLSRIIIIDAVNAGEFTRSFNLSSDLSGLSRMLDHFGDVSLLVIDPVTAYLGKIDSHKTADVRALLAPLGALAAKHGTAIVCVSHLSKGGSGEALLRVTGSLAFVAAARAAFLIARDNGDKNRRLFLPIKNNIGNDETGLAFTIQSVTLSGGIETSRVSWETEAVSTTADEAMAPIGDPEERSVLEDAKRFLANLLADGPVSSRQIRADAIGAGFSWRTIQRAQNALDVDAYKGGMKEGWFWFLPPKDAKKGEERQQKDVALFGNLGVLRSESSKTDIFDSGQTP
ncbi:MAG: AAA family ATPase [Desulfuromonadales bacterium]|nr:AAA family ATPase [Desulfuromonadales bacterium]